MSEVGLQIADEEKQNAKEKWKDILKLKAYRVALEVKSLPANAGDLRDVGSSPQWGKFPGGEQSNPHQYSCLENPMERGAWLATVHRVAKSQTRQK